MYLSGNLMCKKMGSYGDNECKLLNLWQRSILKKGCIWEIMILKKGSLGDTNNVERVFGGA